MRSRVRLVAYLVFAALVLAVAGLIVSRPAAGHRYDIHPGDDLFGRLQRLKAGDDVVIHAGTYRTPGFYEVKWAGTAAAHIVIRGARGEARPVIVGIPTQNVIDIEGSHFTLSHLELRGGSHGLRLADVDHATLEDLVLHHLGDVGISCNRPGKVCDALTIRGSEIYDTGRQGTGEGIYLGCHEGDCVSNNGLVERNFVHDTGGTEGDGIEIKRNSFGNTVRDNVVRRTRYPGITMYGFRRGAGARNVVEHNIVWGTRDDGIRIVGQVIVRDNLVLGAALSGIAYDPEAGVTPSDAVIANNIVVGTRPAAQAIHFPRSSPRSVVTGNVLLRQATGHGG